MVQLLICMAHRHHVIQTQKPVRGSSLLVPDHSMNHVTKIDFSILGDGGLTHVQFITTLRCYSVSAYSIILLNFKIKSINLGHRKTHIVQNNGIQDNQVLDKQ